MFSVEHVTIGEEQSNKNSGIEIQESVSDFFVVVSTVFSKYLTFFNTTFYLALNRLFRADPKSSIELLKRSSFCRHSPVQLEVRIKS